MRTPRAHCRLRAVAPRCALFAGADRRHRELDRARHDSAAATPQLDRRDPTTDRRDRAQAPTVIMKLALAFLAATAAGHSENATIAASGRCPPRRPRRRTPRRRIRRSLRSRSYAVSERPAAATFRNRRTMRRLIICARRPVALDARAARRSSSLPVRRECVDMAYRPLTRTSRKHFFSARNNLY